VLMSVAFLAIAPAFTGRTGVERVLRFVLVIGFVATIGALGVVSALFGLDRQDAFEIAAISIVWLTLAVAGGLMAVVFRRASAVQR